jgi:hypothetical protein
MRSTRQGGSAFPLARRSLGEGGRRRYQNQSLIGDVNGNAVVNSSDVSLSKARVGMPVSGSNFREDVNVNGTISSTDVALVKAKLGTALP